MYVKKLITESQNFNIIDDLNSEVLHLDYLFFDYHTEKPCNVFIRYYENCFSLHIYDLYSSTLLNFAEYFFEEDNEKSKQEIIYNLMIY